MRHTKIVATIGPASSSEAMIRELLASGVDVFRLNFSHGSHETHGETLARIRAAADERGRYVAVLQDLSGPKIRTGRLRDGAPIPLDVGDELRIAVGDFVGGPGRVSTTYAGLPKAVRKGDPLLLDDGRLQLRVEENDGEELRTTVVDGGMLGEHKGINAPGVTLPTAGLTAKDLADLAFGVSMGVDFMALSFVQSAADLRQARDALHLAGAPDLPLVAKIERPEAVARIDEVLDESDAVMIARGDLGLELPLERVPRVQKEITRRARSLGIPVILATQVLESMRGEPRPTRAEVSDAANAVDDGVDAIMLAGETAAGNYPVRAVQTLDAIIRDAETIPPIGVVPLRDEAHLLGDHGRAICEAAVTLAERGEANAIVAVTRGGKTARLLSALRPRTPIYAVTDRDDVSRRLALAWGVVPLLTDLTGDVNEVANRISARLVERDTLPASSVIVVVSITPDLARGPSNFLKLQRV
ncbi:MAG TPA: pyruvate kinase [Vicinamibacterales bacterium]